MKLSEWPLSFVRVSCKTCAMKQDHDRDGLIALFGDEDMSMVIDSFRCGKKCRAFYTDALLVDAITEADESQVLKPELLPEAKKLRAELGIEPR